ncbi:MAG: hypothetical protein ABSG04_06140 [Verrucomicrobiota bacterium]|jgi:hypothetical protein
MKSKIPLCLALVLISSLLGCSTTARHSIADRPSSGSTTDRQWGPASNGLQMSLSVLMTRHRGDPEFEVAFWNAGEQDVCLNLGAMLANGKVQLPDKIHLNLLDASGRSRELHFADRRYPGVAGRLDDYVVPLRVGSTYTLRLRLDQFWSPGTQEFELKLTPGRYEVSAQFQEDRAETRNLIFVWKGKLQSNSVEIVE